MTAVIGNWEKKRVVAKASGWIWRRAAQASCKESWCIRSDQYVGELFEEVVGDWSLSVTPPFWLLDAGWVECGLDWDNHLPAVMTPVQEDGLA